MQLIGMLDSPYVRRVAIALRLFDLPFEHAPISVFSAYDAFAQQVKQLAGLVPICCVCKKIRDDGNFWRQVESYVAEHTDAKFSHGYCPDCFGKIKAEIMAQTA